MKFIIKKTLIASLIPFCFMSQTGFAFINQTNEVSSKQTPTPWCEFLTSDGHWVKSESYTSESDCLGADKRDEGGNAYSWQHEEAEDSSDGRCVVDRTPNGYSRQYQTTKRGCENHDKHGNESYHWESDTHPMVYVGYNHTGYGYILEEDIPSLCHGPEALMRVCHLIKSYHIPEGWIVDFYEGEDYQGQYYRRTFTDQHDEDDFIEGVKINSIRIYSSKISPPTPIEHQITSVRQVYFGSKSPDIECNPYGRLLTAADITNMGGNKNICPYVRSAWAIWKILGADGSKWSFMGTGYQCQMKAGVDNAAQPLCVANTTPAVTEAFLFTEANFANTTNWGGLPEVKKVGEENADKQVKSFLLGSNVKLEGYSETDFAGTKTEYSTSTKEVTEVIKSYKIISNTITRK